MNEKKATQARSWLLLSLCFLVLIVSIYFVLQQRSAPGGTVRQYSETLTDVGFDTFVTYTETTDEESYQAHLALVQERFQYYNELFDYYHTYDGVNNLKTINDSAGKKAVIIEEPLLECLLAARTFYTYSDHFDVTQGALLNVWHNYRDAGAEANAQGKSGTLPSSDELEAAYNAKSWEAVEIDEENHSVYINDASVSIDLGGVAKGFAVQKLYEELTAQGVDNAILNAGGNVMLIGEKSDGTPWRVGVQTPSTSSLESGDVAILSLNGSHAVVTSGDYQRYYEVDGAIISHIVDPTTRWPSQLMRSVSVVCDDSTMADCISTTLFTMTYEEGLRYLQTLKENGIQAEAVWVFDDSCPSIPQSDTAIRSGAFTVLVSDGLIDAISS